MPRFFSKKFNQYHGSTTADVPSLFFLRSLLNPIAIVSSLMCSVLYYQASFEGIYFLLIVMVFILSVYMFDVIHLYRTEKYFPWFRCLLNIFPRWLFTLCMVWLIFLVSGFGYLVYDPVVYSWAIVTPFMLFILQSSARGILSYFFKYHAKKRNAVIIGVDHLGLQLVTHCNMDRFSDLNFLGFFEDRNEDRIPELDGNEILGGTATISDFLRSEDVQVVFIALPMTHQPRVMELLDVMRDSTVSIYFIPDVFITDLIQARFDHIGGTPIIAVCESPFYGFSSLQKRLSDIIFSLIILILISPIMIFIAIGIKLTSKGSILFKQHRYGLDGKEILVYKFRSMTVSENKNVVTQASRNDQRVTRFGSFLRKTSLDELPQFINVLQGCMSIVGPRPHAVAHNELYRQLIKGYMVRHKVKPGITGWAQVNGFRGETDTLEKMAARIDYDLEYLRNWSLWLDIKIIFRTIGVVTGDKNAY
jgi:putative colanic acid biosynthesis UDP-glucose lipid carrier transferase